MFRYPSSIVTSKEYSFVNAKSLNDRGVRKLTSKSGMKYALQERRQLWRLAGRKSSAIYIADKEGVVLPSYVLAQIVKSGVIVDGAVVYAESLGKQVTIIVYSAGRELLLDWVFDFGVSDPESIGIEVQMALQMISDAKVNMYISNGHQMVDSESFKQLAADQGRKNNLNLRKDILNASVQLDKNGLNYDGHFIPWGFGSDSESDESSDAQESAEQTKPNKTEQQMWTCRALPNCFLTELTVDELFQRPCKAKEPKLVPISTLKKQQRRVYYTYAGTVGGVIAAVNFAQYTAQQARIAEQEALKKRQLVVEDPWRKYRNDITNGSKNLQAEFGLKGVSRALQVISTANTPRAGQKPLGWEVGEMVVTGPVITITPYSMGGSYTDLKDFVEKRRNSFRLRFNETGAHVDSAIPPVRINEKPYISSAEDETSYIADAVSWLFEDVTVTTDNRAVNGEGIGQYRVHLVKLAFTCWLSEDFEYLATQFAYRNYSLHSIKLKNEALTRFDEEGNVIDNNKCDFGYSGDLFIQVFGK